MKDATIYENNVDHSFGAGVLLAGRTTTSGRFPSLTRRALLSFDTSGIPTGSTIESVELTLYVTKESPRVDTASPTDLFHLHRLLADWGESTNNGAAFPGDPPGQGEDANNGDATWDSNLHGSSTWSTAGGDFVATPSASQQTGPLVGTGSPVGVTWSGPGLVDDVQSWLDGASGNHGWVLIGDEALGERTARRFGSRESVSSSPTLVITYTAIPEPNCFLLAATAWGFLPSRRSLAARCA